MPYGNNNAYRALERRPEAPAYAGVNRQDIERISRYPFESWQEEIRHTPFPRADPRPQHYNTQPFYPELPTSQAYNAYFNSYMISAQRPIDRFTSTQPLLIQTLPSPQPHPTAYGAPPTSWRSRGAIEPATANSTNSRLAIDATTAREIGNAVVTSIGQGQAGSAWLSNGGSQLNWRPENCCFMCRKIIGMRKHYREPSLCLSALRSR